MDNGEIDMIKRAEFLELLKRHEKQHTPVVDIPKPEKSGGLPVSYSDSDLGGELDMHKITIEIPM